MIKKLAFLLTLCAFLFFAFGCGGESSEASSAKNNSTTNTEKEPNQKENTASSKEQKEPVTIVMSGWPGNPDEEAAIKAMVEAFNSQSEDIKLEWVPIPGDYAVTLKTKLSGGTGPDLFYVDVYLIEEFVKNNTLLSLDRYIKKDNFEIDDYFPALVDAFTIDGNIYGIAKDFSTLALWYNKEMFDKYGVSYPTNNMTWEDLTQKALQLKGAGLENPLVLSTELTRAMPAIFSYGGTVVDEELSCALGETQSKKGLQMYFDLATKHKVGFDPQTIGSSWIGDALSKEKVAMGMSGPWTIGFLKGSAPEIYKKMDVVEMPSGSDGKATMIYTVCWAINRQTKHKDEAWEALKFLVTDGQKIFVDGAGVLGSKKSIANNDTNDEIKNVFYDGVKYGHPWRVSTPTGIFSKANDSINSRFRDVFFEKKTLDEAIKEITAFYDSWVSGE